MSSEVSLFVPGRVCLLGEHTDWAANYRNANGAIPEGQCIVYGTSCGLHATARTTADGSFHFRSAVVVGSSALADNEPDEFICSMNAEALSAVAADGGFYSYACGTAAVVMDRYAARIAPGVGVSVNVYKVDLPMKKGLSSSAACCVLVARAFSELFHLQLSTEEEMDVAYLGELKTPSRCGRMDQCCAYGRRGVLMTFDGSSGARAEAIHCGKTFFFVVADLNASKDTKKILADLNAAYPHPQSPLHQGVHTFLGEVSQSQVQKAIQALHDGDAVALGAVLSETQRYFREHMEGQCPSELSAPRLYAVLQHPRVLAHSLGGKGVGSQGDGTVQFVCANETEQDALFEVLGSAELNCTPFKFILPRSEQQH
jgi:galactokinase